MDPSAHGLAGRPDTEPGPRGEPPAFEDLYAAHFDFVWRNLRRQGVPDSSLEDAVQDTFLVVHRRLADLRPDASPRAWLFTIALRVAHDYHRRSRRKPAVSFDVERHAGAEDGPFERTAAAQAARALQEFLAGLDADKRAVFVLAELEQMSAPEMSQALGAGINTIYSRLRVARERFLAFLAQRREAK